MIENRNKVTCLLWACRIFVSRVVSHGLNQISGIVKRKIERQSLSLMQILL
ncbi:hypothetical protein BACFIN_05629 [Bacteroides finegoldii DSM 17565]|nr:hypothetical protein BACFIN_05629 [Bacteroides finegoldii DSM 17565]